MNSLKCKIRITSDILVLREAVLKDINIIHLCDSRKNSYLPYQLRVIHVITLNVQYLLYML